MKCKDCDKLKCLDRGYGEAECVYCDGQSFASQQQLQQPSKNIDWQSFRNQASKDILCAMIQGGYAESRIEHQSALAVKYADTLILRLKEKEEK